MNDAIARRLFKYNGVFKEVKDLDESPDLKLDEIYNTSGDLYVFRGYESESNILKTSKKNNNKYLDGLYYDEKENTFITKGDPIGKLTECIEQNAKPDVNQLIENLKILQSKNKKETIENKIDNTLDVSILAKKTKVGTYNEKTRMDKEMPLKFKIVDEDELPVQIIKNYINEHTIFYKDIEEYYAENGKSGGEYNLYYGLRERHTMAFSTFQTWCDLLNLDMNLSVTER